MLPQILYHDGSEKFKMKGSHGVISFTYNSVAVSPVQAGILDGCKV